MKCSQEVPRGDKPEPKEHDELDHTKTDEDGKNHEPSSEPELPAPDKGAESEPEKEEDPEGPTDQVPASVTFFGNGMAAVCNSAGEQIPKFQGRKEFAIKALEEAGYPLDKIPSVWPRDMFRDLCG